MAKARPATRRSGDTATPAEGLRRTAAPSAGKSERVKSASEFADLLGISRTTVTKWCRDGMPYEGGEPADGKAYRIDVGVAVRWLQERAAAEARTEAASIDLPADGGETLEDAKTRKERALANAAESDAVIKAIVEAEKRGSVGPISTMHEVMRQEYASLSGALSKVGRLVELKLRRNTPERIGREVDTMIREALAENLRGDIEAAMEVDDTPEVEPHVGP
ncbi:phage terminase Nu1 subunit (DNA packaging protein) [Methylorubrum extorquens]